MLNVRPPAPKGAPIKPNSRSQKWVNDPIAVPPEVEVTYVYAVKGSLYTRIDGKTCSIAKLVYAYHYPKVFIAPRARIWHIDGNKENNVIENLTNLKPCF